MRNAVPRAGYAEHMIRKSTPTQVRENAYNAAQEAREAADDEIKKIADVPSVHGGETWGNASGHSGTHTAWLSSGAIITGFILGGVGFTVGPRLLIWIGVAVVLFVGVFSVVTHAWSDYRLRAESDAERPAAPTHPTTDSARESGAGC